MNSSKQKNNVCLPGDGVGMKEILPRNSLLKNKEICAYTKY